MFWRVRLFVVLIICAGSLYPTALDTLECGFLLARGVTTLAAQMVRYQPPDKNVSIATITTKNHLPLIGGVTRLLHDTIASYNHWSDKRSRVLFGLLFLVDAHSIWSLYQDDHMIRQEAPNPIMHEGVIDLIESLSLVVELCAGITLAFHNQTTLASSLLFASRVLYEGAHNELRKNPVVMQRGVYAFLLGWIIWRLSYDSCLLNEAIQKNPTDIKTHREAKAQQAQALELQVSKQWSHQLFAQARREKQAFFKDRCQLYERFLEQKRHIDRLRNLALQAIRDKDEALLRLHSLSH